MHKSAMQMQAQDVHNRVGGTGAGGTAALGLQAVNSNGSKLLSLITYPTTHNFPPHLK